jgi:hypothetical protein
MNDLINIVLALAREVFSFLRDLPIELLIGYVIGYLMRG